MKRVLAYLISELPGKLVGFLFSLCAPPANGRQDRYRELSMALSLLPFGLGRFARYYFYKRTLISVGSTVNFMLGVIVEGRNCRIGDDVYVGYRSVVFDFVEIGNAVMIAHNSTLMSGGRQHGAGKLSINLKDQEGEVTGISIGDDVWIGANSTIMASVGAHSIVGAGSVVVKAASDYVVVVGNPARVVKDRRATGGGK